MKRSHVPNAKRKATAYRNIAADVPDDKILNHTDAIFTWADDTAYEVGIPVVYDGQYWRCLTAHNSNAAASWIPWLASSLWARIGNPADEWPEWIQPTGGHNAYDIGKKVTYKGKRYISKINANTTVPGSDARWWEEAV